jgi:predicted Zn-dependent peptidase
VVEAAIAIAVAVAAAAAATAAGAAGADPARPLTEPIRSTVLGSGIRVVTERMPEVRSVTIGCYVSIGGRDEPEPLGGASHFLEHLLFKGTEARVAREIASSVDTRGGEMNAFTAREHTAFYVRLPSSETGFGVELLGDVVARPAFRPDEVESERQVILEELLLSEDEPDERSHTLCMEGLFPDHPLGREVLGTGETIAAMARDDIAAFHDEHYRSANLVLVAAGDLHHDEVADLVDGAFPSERAGGRAPSRLPPTSRPAPHVTLTRPTEQAHLTFGWRGLDLHDPDRYALAVLNQILGGGMSSRLFHEIREQRGLAYSVYSYSALYSDAGALMVYAGTTPARAAQVRELIEAEVASLLADGVTGEELAVARGYLEGSMLLGLEDSGSRMARLGGGVIARGEVTSVDEHVRRVRAVELDDVARVIDRVFAHAPTAAVVGPCKDL